MLGMADDGAPMLRSAQVDSSFHRLPSVRARSSPSFLTRALILTRAIAAATVAHLIVRHTFRFTAHVHTDSHWNQKFNSIATELETPHCNLHSPSSSRRQLQLRMRWLHT
jgi:hypothetical protein